MLVTILPSTLVYMGHSIESIEMASGLGLVGSYLYVCYDLYSILNTMALYLGFLFILQTIWQYGTMCRL